MSTAVSVLSKGARLRRCLTATPFRTVRSPRARAAVVATGMACAMLQITAGSAFAGCKPSHPRPTIVLKDMGTKDTGAKEFGACGFDPQTMSYRGEPVEQAKCLMRSMDATRNLAPMLDSLPSALASRVGQDGGLPTREVLSALLSKQDLEWDFAYFLWQPISRANDDDPATPMARYFVIHDTSGPNFGHHAFPDDLNVNPRINNLASFKCDDGWGRAHIVISRSGGMLVNHDYGIPWRETKFERAVNFNGALKGLFVHNELIQPRRAASGRGRYNDAQTPDPGFTGAQYDRLALLYTIASVRSGRWLIPAFHAAIDAGIPNGHDDPLNFSIASFADSLQRLIDQLNGGGATVAAAPAPAPAQTAPPVTEAKDATSEPAAATAQAAPVPKPVDALDPPAATATAAEIKPFEQTTANAASPDSKPDAMTAVAVEAKSEPVPETSAQNTTATRAAPVAQTKPDTPVETKPEPATEAKPETTAETKVEAAAATKPETTVETKAEPAVETKPEPAAETKPEVKSESKATPKSETKPEAALEAERKAQRETAEKARERAREKAREEAREEARKEAKKEAERKANRERRARHCEAHRHHRHGCDDDDDDATERHSHGKRTHVARATEHRGAHGAWHRS